MSIAIDTNILVRILIQEPSAPDQCAAAHSLVAEAILEPVVTEHPEIDVQRLIQPLSGKSRRGSLRLRRCEYARGWTISTEWHRRMAMPASLTSEPQVDQRAQPAMS